MNSLRPPLPEFRRPPVVELVLDVQFQSIPGLGVPQLGLLWQEFRDRFPTVEQQPPLAPMVERFGPPAPDEAQVLFEPIESLPLPRLWFLDATARELIQVQNDRFIHNWRKTQEDDTYPRYETVRTRFAEELATFERFLAKESLGPVVPDLCEVTYINHLIAGQDWAQHGEIDSVVTLWRNQFSDSFLEGKHPENVSVNLQYVILGEEGEPLGRWRVAIQPAYRRTDGKPILVIRNTARGKASGEDMEGALNALDIGHEWAVRGFASITTAHMHSIWGRTDGR